MNNYYNTTRLVMISFYILRNMKTHSTNTTQLRGQKKHNILITYKVPILSFFSQSDYFFFNNKLTLT